VANRLFPQNNNNLFMYLKSLIALLVSSVSFTSCAQRSSVDVKIPVAATTKPVKGEAVATFAEGCFWHSEIVFQSLVGVRDAVSGYAGGTDTRPDYEKVSTGETGHAESVQVYYDPAVISYQTLVQAFFASQDPTQLNRQGNDVGTEYRSVAFYRSEKEKEIIAAEIASLTASGKYKNKIVTQVVPFTKFYPAEDYHQEYISQHPSQPYVRSISIPDFMHFKNNFKGPFKE
jgi:peptide-methionine (S)-S-oxide reductase